MASVIFFFSPYKYGGDGTDVFVGWWPANWIYGNGGNDILTAFGGFNYLNGGSGNDFIGGYGVANVIEGGSGSDVIIAGGVHNTIVAGSNSDYVTSFGLFNTIFGNSGNDVITGFGTINTIFGGSDNDVITGFGAVNTMFGESGDDVLTGFGAVNTILGGSGNDVITGHGAVNTMLGGDGDDVLNGAGGVNTILGGSGNDVITGAGVFNAVGGDSGDDVIVGAGLFNTVSGDDGNDVIVGAGAYNTMGGGRGNDVITGIGLYNDMSGHGGNDVMVGAGAINNMFGNSGDDYLIGVGILNIMSGGDGADKLITVSGINVILGGEGDDLIAAFGFGVNYMFGGAGNDDIINYSILDSTAYGGDGDDEIISFAIGWSSMDGGAGDDRMRAYFGILTASTGGEGNDDIFVNGVLNIAAGGSGNDKILANGGINIVSGDSGDDNITLNSALNIAVGGNGNDTFHSYGVLNFLSGGAGDDTFNLGGLGLVFAGTGENGETESNDDIKYAPVFNTVEGGAGNDTFISGGDNDLSGDEGNDTLVTTNGGNLSGGSGNDVMADLQGQAELYGGNDRDIIIRSSQILAQDNYFQLRSGVDLLAEFTSSLMYPSQDVLDGISQFDAVYQDYVNEYLMELKYSTYGVAKGDSDNDILIGMADLNNLEGGIGNDVLITNGDVNILSGGSGNDLIVGSGFYNELNGGYDQDLIIGSGYKNIIADGLGSNILIGIGLENIIRAGSESALGSAPDQSQLDELSKEDVLIGLGLQNRMYGGMGNNVYLAGGYVNDINEDYYTTDALVEFGDNFIVSAGHVNRVNVLDGNNIVFGSGTDLRDLFGLPVGMADMLGINRFAAENYTHTINAGDGANLIVGAGDENSITVGNGDSVIVASGFDINSMVPDGGSTANNDIIAGDGNNIIYSDGLAGDITSGHGDNFIIFGGGINNVAAGSGNNIILDNSSNETTINAGSGNNFIVASTTNKNDVTVGNGNNAILSVGSINDVVTGGEASLIFAKGDYNTIVAVTPGSPITTSQDQLIVGQAVETQDITTSVGNDTIISSAKVSVINAGDGGNLLIASGDDITITTESGNDIIVVQSDVGSIDSGDGDDTIINIVNENSSVTAGSGSDVIVSIGWSFDNNALSQAVNDANQMVQDVSAQIDQWYGDATSQASSHMNGYALNKADTSGFSVLNQIDLNISNIYADNIEGGAGNDFLSGGLGDDNLSGGADNDAYGYWLGDGNDIIAEQSAGGSDILEIYVNSSLGNAELDVTQDLTFSLANSNQDLIIDLTPNGGSSIGFITIENMADVDSRIEQLHLYGLGDIVNYQSLDLLDIYNSLDQSLPLNLVTSAGQATENVASKQSDQINSFLLSLDNSQLLSVLSANIASALSSVFNELEAEHGTNFLSGIDLGNIDSRLAQLGYDSNAWLADILSGQTLQEFVAANMPDLQASSNFDFLANLFDAVGNQLFDYDIQSLSNWLSLNYDNNDFLEDVFVSENQIDVDDDLEYWEQRAEDELNAAGQEADLSNQPEEETGPKNIDGEDTDEDLTGSSFDDVIKGNGGHDNIAGMDGADDIEGGFGDDIITGGDGDDILKGDSGEDEIVGGSGNDTIMGGDGDDTLVGDEGSDNISGDYGDDQIMGGEGNDTIHGNEGNDRIYGGSGDDDIYGDSGSDHMFGEAGNDTIYGGGGDDLIGGGEGDDEIYGEDGNDSLRGDEGDDLLYGGIGQDELRGGNDDDILYGGVDNDVLKGDDGKDTLYGEDGDDTLFGGDHSDILFGDAGNDLILAGQGNDTLDGGLGDDVLIGGSGYDTASYEKFSTGVNINLEANQAVSGGEIDTLDSIEAAIGTEFDDVFIGNGLDNELVGLGGNNIYTGGEGADRYIIKERANAVDTITDFESFQYHRSLEKIDLTAFDENASVNITSLDDLLPYLTEDGQGVTINLPNNQKVIIEGLAIADFDQRDFLFAGSLLGTAGNDLLLGTTGDDIIIGLGGNDIIRASDGNDILDGGTGGPDGEYGDELDGENDFDIVTYFNSDDAVTVNLETGFADGGHAKGDTLLNIEGLIGSDLDDSLIGDSNNNLLEGGSGADFIDGGDGFDTASYNASIFGVVVDLNEGIAEEGDATGDELVNIEALKGSGRDDILKGSDLGNDIEGQDGDDIIDGKGDDDYLDGGLGNDILTGGAGEDVFVIAQEDDVTDTIKDFTPFALSGGTEKVDLRQFATILGFGDLVMIDTTDGVDIALENNQHLIIEGITIADLSASDFLFFGSNTILGRASDDTLQGSDFNDEMIGLAGNDNLIGGLGNDVIFGGSGNDLLEGGLGADILNGDGGFDIADYRNSTVEVSVDLLNNIASGGDAEGDIFQEIEGVDGSGKGDDLKGDNSANILIGNDGDDKLEGRLGADTLDGGAGTDTAVYTNSQSGVNINFITGVNTGGDAEGDILNSIEVIQGSDFDDIMISDNHGHAFYGGLGNDTLIGGHSEDVISGGLGNDIMTGGGGQDFFIIEKEAGAYDIITDFDDSRFTWEMIDLRGFAGLTLGDLTYTNVAEGVEIGLGDGQVLLLEGLTASDVNGLDAYSTFAIDDGDDFIIVSGEQKVEFQANTHITGNQAFSSVTALNNGNFIVTWSGEGLPDSSGVYAQIFDSSGTKIGSEFLVNDSSTFSQSRPSVSALSNGNFVVTWQSVFQDGSQTGVYMKVFNSSGVEVRGETQVNTHTPLWQEHAGVIGLNNGNFVITWQGNGPDGLNHIYAQMFNSAGDKIAGEFEVNAPSANHRYNPSIDLLENGNFVVSWLMGDSIYAQILDENGNKIGTEINIGNNAFYELSVTGLKSGGFIVAWEGDDQSGRGIFAQILDENGNKLGEVFQVNNYSNLDQRFPDVSYINSDSFVVTWQSIDQDGDVFGIFAQVYDNNGNKLGDEFQVNDYTIGSQQYPAINTLNNGDYIIAWQSNGQDGNVDGIFAKIITPEGYITGTSDADVLIGLESDDAIHGYADNDIILGGGGDDIIYGGDGYDEIHDGDGDDIVYGGKNNDKFYGSLGSDQYIGGDGIDSIYYEDANSGVEVNLETGQGGGYASGDSYSEIEYVWGSDFDDIITGDIQSNVLRGQLGNDIINGGAGDDNLYGGDGDDIINGGDGTDIIDGGQGIDTISFADTDLYVVVDMSAGLSYGEGYANSSDGERYDNVENVTGSQGSDTLTGNDDVNVIQGEAGGDNIDGRDGDDVLEGGLGDDVIRGGLGADFIDGGEGRDTATYNGSSAVTLNLESGINSGGEAEGDTLISIENLIGSDFDDNITGGRGHNRLSGGLGNDILDGGRGNDVINGDEGDNVLTGGEGFDSFVIGQFAGATTTITDFTPGGLDKIDLSRDFSFKSVGELTISDTQDGAEIDLGNNQKIVLQGVLSSELTTSDFIFDTEFKITTGSGGSDARITTLKSGNVLVAISSDSGVFAKVIDSNEQEIVPEFNVNVNTHNDYFMQSVSLLQNGNFVVVWSEGFSDSFFTNLSLRARIFDSNGIAINASNDIDVAGYNFDTSAINARVTTLSNGNFVVVWQNEDSGSGLENIYGQIYSESGNSLNTFQISDGIADKTRASIVALDNGNFVVTWSDSGEFFGDSRFKAQIFNSNGVGLSGEFYVNDVFDNFFFHISSTSLNNGNFAVTWEHNGQIFVRLFNEDGDQLSSEILVNFNSQIISNNNPVITTLESGDFVVAWEKDMGGDLVVVQLFDENGNKIGSERHISNTLYDSISNIQLTALENDDFMVSWRGVVQGESSVFAEIVRNSNVVSGSINDDILIGNELDNTILADDGNDKLFGNGGDDILEGDAGDDYLDGGSGADSIDGGDGIDTVSYELSEEAVSVDLETGEVSGGEAEGDVIANVENIRGSDFNDMLTGDVSDNVIEGGAGADIIDGGSGGADTASYENSAEGVSVSLADNTATGGDAEGDKLTNITNLTGSAHDDVLTGDDLDNTLTGNDGDDILEGGAGADVIDGGEGFDLASYENASEAVTIDMENAIYTGADTVGDTFINIEGFRGSAFDDELRGDAGDNRLEGWDGNDTLYSGVGIDILVGGEGADQFVIHKEANGITTIEDFESTQVIEDLEAPVVNYIKEQVDLGAFDNLHKFEDLIFVQVGSDLHLNLIDNQTVIFKNKTKSDFTQNDFVFNAPASLPNENGDYVEGGGDDDTLVGTDNNDFVDGGAGNDSLDGGLGDDYIDGGAGDDQLQGGDGNDYIEGGDGDDVLGGGVGDDIMVGGAGADRFNGGDGNDTVDYSNSSSAVNVNLAGTGSVGDAEGDTYSNIEVVKGSNYDDQITGDAGENLIEGGLGNDIMAGGAGDDTFKITKESSSQDTITDYSPYVHGSDQIDLREFTHIKQISDLIIQQVGADTVIDFGDGQTLLITGITATDLVEQDFIFSPAIEISQDIDGDAFNSQINNNVLISAYSDGAYVVIGETAANDAIVGQAYDFSGQILGATFTVSNIPGLQAFTTLTDDKFVVFRTDLSNQLIGQFFDRDGDSISAEFTVAASADLAVVSKLDSNNFVVVWEEVGVGVNAQIYSNDGQTQSSVLSLGSIDINALDITTISVSSFAVSDTSGVVNVYDTSGANTATITPVIAVVDPAYPPQVDLLSDGNLVASWHDSGEVYAQVFDAAGNGVSSIISVNTTMANEQSRPVVAALPFGQFMIAWQSDGQDGDGFGIYTQLFENDGTKLYDETRINALNIGDQVNPTLTFLQDGGFVVTWEDSVNGLLRANVSVPTPIATVAPIVATSGDDILDGNELVDEIDGLAGNDTIQGFADDDILIGGEGDDTIDGGEDNDEIYGDVGNDTLYGSDGDDIIDGGFDDDFIYGGEGDDTIYGLDGNNNIEGGYGDDVIELGSGNNIASGGLGNDIITAVAGINTISGGEGGDILDGGTGTDTINGDAGNDIINGGLGADIMNGGDGRDTFIIIKDAGTEDTIVDFEPDKSSSFIINKIMVVFLLGEDPQSPQIQGNALWQELLTKGWIRQVSNKEGLVVKTADRLDPDLSSTFKDYVEIIESMMDQSQEQIDLSAFDDVINSFDDLVITQDNLDVMIDLGNGQTLRLKNTDITDISAQNFKGNAGYLNVAPEAILGRFEAEEDSIDNAIDVLSEARDENGDQVSIVSASGAQHGSVSVQGGMIYYTPNADYSGTDSIYYEINDEHGLIASNVIEVTVNPTNDKPLAYSFNTDADVDTIVTITLPDADDVEDGAVAATQSNVILSNVTAGAIALVNPDGTISYTPPVGFIGQDSFSYQIVDSGALASDPVSINIDVPKVLAISLSDNYAISADVYMAMLDQNLDAIPVIESPDGQTVYPDAISSQRMTIAEDGEATVTFKNSVAGYNNSLGWYVVEEDGTIGETHLLFKAAKSTAAGTEFSLGTLAAGTEIGFFVISNGASSNVPASGGNLRFEDASGNEVSVYGTETAYLRFDGGTSNRKVFLSHSNGYLNADNQVHGGAGWDSAKGDLLIGLEDLYGGGDRDYNDILFHLDLGSASEGLKYATAPGLGGVSLTGADQIASATVEITSGYLAGDHLVLEWAGYDGGNQINGTNISIASSVAAGVLTLTLTGLATSATYESVLNALRLVNDGASSDVSGTREIAISVTDEGAVTSSIDTSLHIANNPGADTDSTNSLTGTAENDGLYGRDGNDAINGGAGNDLINGGAGADVLTGGAGSDSFDFSNILDSTATARDTITDFTKGEDTINLAVLVNEGIISGFGDLTITKDTLADTTTIESTNTNDNFEIQLLGDHDLDEADFNWG